MKRMYRSGQLGPNDYVVVGVDTTAEHIKADKKQEKETLEKSRQAKVKATKKSPKRHHNK